MKQTIAVRREERKSLENLEVVLMKGRMLPIIFQVVVQGEDDDSGSCGGVDKWLYRGSGYWFREIRWLYRVV